MKQYDLIFWGWDAGKKHRKRAPLVVSPEKPLYQGQKLGRGDIPEMDAERPRYPVTVEDVVLPESADSDRAFCVVESKPTPSATVGQ